MICFIVEEDHRVGALAPDFVRLTRFIASHIPALNRTHFVIGGDKVARTVRHPYYVVYHILLRLKALHDTSLLREALKAN